MLKVCVRAFLFEKLGTISGAEAAVEITVSLGRAYLTLRLLLLQ